MRRGKPPLDVTALTEATYGAAQTVAGASKYGAAAVGVEELESLHQQEVSAGVARAEAAWSLQTVTRDDVALAAPEGHSAAGGKHMSTPRGPALMEADETLLTAKISSVCMQPDDDQVPSEFEAHRNTAKYPAG
jgi:hypothetical protein